MSIIKVSIIFSLFLLLWISSAKTSYLSSRFKNFRVLGLAAISCLGGLGLFISPTLELLMISEVVLTLGMTKLIHILPESKKSKEASLKFFVSQFLGSLFLLLGLFYYRAHFSEIVPFQTVASDANIATQMPWIMLLVTIGCFIKMGVAPFALWKADVHEGAAALWGLFLHWFQVLGCFIVLLKFSAIIRGSLELMEVMVFFFALTVLYNGLLSLVQCNFKRRLQYLFSCCLGIAGLIMSYQNLGQASLLFLAASSFVLGLPLLMLVSFESEELSNHLIEDFKGFYKQSKFYACAIVMPIPLVLIILAALLFEYRMVFGQWIGFNILIPVGLGGFILVFVIQGLQMLRKLREA